MREMCLGAVLGVLFAASGCATVPLRPVPSGLINTEGVTIRAEDGSFTLTSGQRFQPPFYTRDCIATATSDNFAIAKQMGARPVMVKVPGRDAELYGLLALCRVHPDATGPATRQYLIEIPQSYVDATSGGRISVVYEQTNAGRQFADGFQNFDAWQLWLSEIPFI